MNPLAPSEKAIAGWVTAAALIVTYSLYVHLPCGGVRVLVTMAAALALRHLPDAIAAHQQRQSADTTFVRIHQIISWVQGVVDATPLTRRVLASLAGAPPSLRASHKVVSLGYGFPWSAAQAQMTYEQLRVQKTIASVPTHDAQGHAPTGARWIHGLGREAPLGIATELANGHTIIVGTTGAGKTMCFRLLIAQAIARGETVIVLDPKGDRDMESVMRETYGLMGKAHLYKYFHPAHPQRSVRINSIRNFQRPTEVGSRIAALIPSETGADPFKAFSSMALTVVVAAMTMVGERPTLVSIKHYLEGGIDALVIKAISHWCDRQIPSWQTAARRYTEKSTDLRKRAKALAHYYSQDVVRYATNPDIEALIAMFHHDRTHFDKMITSLFPVLNALTAGEMGRLLSPNVKDDTDDREIVDIANITERGGGIYIGLDSLSDTTVGTAIGALILAELASMAGDRYNYSDRDALRPVNVFVDEAAEIVNDPLIQNLNKGRGAKMRVIMAMQTFADLVKRTGSNAAAEQVLGNVNNVIALRTLDGHTQKYVTQSFLPAVITQVSRSQSTNVSADRPAAHGGSVGESMSEKQVELFPPALLGQLPNMHYLARLASGHVVKGRIPIVQ